ncbi:hypothetical protein M918_18980 [Clostridium sp. BL8]|nr:hypothetical protein M918_18980 [Clostridium sp. BL8]
MLEVYYIQVHETTILVLGSKSEDSDAKIHVFI